MNKNELHERYICLAFQYESAIDALLTKGLVDMEAASVAKERFYDTLNEERLLATQKIKLYRFSYHSLWLCCSDKSFHPLLGTVNRIFVNWEPRFQPHLSAGRRITNPNTFSLHINYSCSYQLGAGTSFLPPSYAQSNPNAKKCNADYAQYQREQ